MEILSILGWTNIKKKMKRILRHLLLLIFLSTGFSVAAQTTTGKAKITQENKKEKVVYVTKTGTKYHGTNCGYLKSSKIKNTLSSAVKSGYTACSRCKGSASYKPKTTSRGSSSTTSKQCSGTTKAGNRCRRMTKSSNGRCYQH